MQDKIPTQNQVYQRRKHVLSAQIGNELVMMCLDTGQYFNFNAVGSHIWGLIEMPMSLDTIVATLAEAYDAPESAIRAEAEHFLRRLEQDKMVTSGSSEAT